MNDFPRNKELDEHARKNSNLLTAYFFETRCRKCMDTKLQKKRDCDLLYGYKKPCCKLMDNFIEKYNKPINELALMGNLKTLISLKGN